MLSKSLMLEPLLTGRVRPVTLSVARKFLLRPLELPCPDWTCPESHFQIRRTGETG